MKTYTLKRNSWHYWLADFADKVDTDTDICTYIRKVFQGVFALLILIVACTAVAAFIGTGVWNILNVLFFTASLNPAGIIFISVFLGAVLVGLNEYYKNKRTHGSVEHKEPGFVSLAYRKFKDKTCFRIRIEE